MRGSSQPLTCPSFTSCRKLALAHDRVGQVEAGKLDLLRAGTAPRRSVQEPVVQRPVVLKLQGADGVGDPLQGIATGRGHSRTWDRCTRRPRCGGGSACLMRYMTGSRMLMFGEAMSILARRVRAPSGNSPARIRVNRSRFSSTRAVPKGAFPARLGQGAPVLPDLLGAQVADIGLARLDQLQGILVELLKIVRGDRTAGPPSRTPASARRAMMESTYSTSSLAGVGVVEPEVADAAELGGEAEIEADGLGVADVEVAVGLGRKAGMIRLFLPLPGLLRLCYG